MSQLDFTRRRHFPGTLGNPFDHVLRIADLIDRLPALIFAALLLGLAVLSTWARTYLVASSFPLYFSLALWFFFLGDWALLAALPRARKSFGPAKPPTVVLACLRLIPAMLPIAFALPAQLVGAALVIYSFWIEPHRLGLTHQSLRSTKLELTPSAEGTLRPLRLLHLGDLHIERITNRERHMLQLARSVAPDLILFSGDFLNLSNLHDPVAWADVRQVLRELAALANPPLGIFAVSGSPAVDLAEVVPQLLDGLPIRWLRDEKVTLDYHGQPIDLVGLACTHKPFEDGPRLRSVLDADPASLHDRRELERFTILLYHTPDLAPEASALGIDLQLSGHTHGGQVRLPFYGALYAGSLYGKRFESGRRQIGQMTLYVTRGIGMEGKGAPRVRFLCPPEIILWELSA